MKDIVEFDGLVERIGGSGRITEDDVRTLRRTVFPDGVVSEAEAAAVFVLDHTCPEKHPDWTRFYVEALTDYFVWQSTPRGYVSEEQAVWLMTDLGRDGRIAGTSELELLVGIVHWCTDCPAALAELALAAVRDSVLAPATAAYGSNRPPAVIAAEDVELIRKLIYAPGSPGGFTVTRAEAELLVELDRKSDASQNAASWPDLFARAVANALMFPEGAPLVPSAGEALRRERWLAERGSIGEMLAGIGRAAARGDVPVMEALRSLDPPGARRAAEDAAEAARVAEALRREAIDAEEAAWLLAQFGGDAPLTEGARRLLRFVAENAPAIDPALRPLLARAGP